MSKAPILFIVRGHPGSGKSTYAKHILAQRPGAVHIEKDSFFVDAKGVYRADPAKRTEAEAWCLESVRKSLKSGRDTVVSNTFTARADMVPYMGLGCRVQVVEMAMDLPDTHQVPAAEIAAKKAAFEKHPGAVQILEMQKAIPAPARHFAGSRGPR